MKVVINDDWGHFNLSNEAVTRLYELGGEVEVFEPFDIFGPEDGWEFAFAASQAEMLPDVVIDGKIVRYSGSAYENPRSRCCPKLVQVVEELGQRASGLFSSLKIIEVPDDVDFYIGNDGGIEHVAERHRMWS